MEIYLKQAWKEAMDCNGFENKETDTEYNIDETEDSIMISFKGSTSKLDWVQNLSFFKKPYKRMSKIYFVHSGFIKKYKSIRPDVVNAIRHSFTYDKLLKIRGYSQGGALALLAHEEAYYQIHRHAETIVFGCPRVFSIFRPKELKLRMSRVVRVQNSNDAVTKLPFLWMLYRHYGSAENIGKKRRWWKLSIKDHQNYRENL